MATHEQLPSTSSRPALDPTISPSTGSLKPHQAAETSASTTTSEHEDGTTIAPRTVNIGTRRSALALAQTDLVLAALRLAQPQHAYVVHAMSTAGDKNQAVALHDFGAKALWTQELEAELLAGRLDVVVHCLKDMPTQLPAGCALGIVCAREDARDALVVKAGLAQRYSRIAELPSGSVIGTSSVRRSAQVKKRHPGLAFRDVRGNIGTRLAKLDDEKSEYTALILAAAGLKRMGWGDRISQLLDSRDDQGGMLHAVGQGALTLEIREGDEEIMRIIGHLEEPKSALAGLAERSLMRTLEGGCSIPLGVETSWEDDGRLRMKGIVVSLDGQESVQAERIDAVTTKEQADEFGWKLAQTLVEKGATKILESIKLNRTIIEQQGGA